MPRHRLAPLVLSLAIAHGAQAASLTPPNLVTASSLAGPDLLLVWPYASGGPLEAMSWASFTAQMQAAIGGAYLKPANNLSDLGNPTVARTNLGLGTAATVNTGSSGATLCLANAACTRGALTTFPASTSGGAPLNVPQGVAPASPNNGDMWTTSSDVYAQIAGSTQQMGQPPVVTPWTPTLGFNVSGSPTVVYSTQSAQTIKIPGPGASVCIASFNIATSTFTFAGASGSLVINGLSPSANATWAGTGGGTLNQWSGLTGATSTPNPYVQGSSNQISFTNGATSNSAINTGQLTSGTNLTLKGSVTYVC